MTKFSAPSPYADPEAAGRRILEIAKEVEPAMEGRIYIELINGPFLFRDCGSVAEYGAGLRLLIERKQIAMHDSGKFIWLPEIAPPPVDAEEPQSLADLPCGSR